MSHLHKYSDPLLSTLLKHLRHRLQPRVLLGMMLQAWHLYLGSFSHSSLQILSSSVSLDGLLTSYFQVSPEMLDRVQVQALAGPLKDILRFCHEATRALSWLCGLIDGSSAEMVVLLEGSPITTEEL